MDTGAADKTGDSGHISQDRGFFGVNQPSLWPRQPLRRKQRGRVSDPFGDPAAVRPVVRQEETGQSSLSRESPRPKFPRAHSRVTMCRLLVPLTAYALLAAAPPTRANFTPVTPSLPVATVQELVFDRELFVDVTCAGGLAGL
jgi:hypothetical protein